MLCYTKDRESSVLTHLLSQMCQHTSREIGGK